MQTATFSVAYFMHFYLWHFAVQVKQEVSHPGGIAADSFHLYWTNKAQGTTAGSNTMPADKMLGT
eukprot:91119-Amphidinium_carterae.2